MSVSIHVMLVNDDPAIRLLIESISPATTIEACSSGLEALNRAARQIPDLIILDYRLNDMSGIELLAKMRLCCPQIAAVMLATRADIAGPLAGSRRQVEEFIERPFFVERALPCIQRVLDRVALNKTTSEASDFSSVRGSLTQMSVLDLMQILDTGRKTCRLVLICQNLVSRIYFHDGHLVHATCGNLSGKAVIHEVVGWTAGAFLIDFERGECPHTITQSSHVVLLEALHLLDESRRMLEPKFAS